MHLAAAATWRSGTSRILQETTGSVARHRLAARRFPTLPPIQNGPTWDGLVDSDQPTEHRQAGPRARPSRHSGSGLTGTPRPSFPRTSSEAGRPEQVLARDWRGCVILECESVARQRRSQPECPAATVSLVLLALLPRCMYGEHGSGAGEVGRRVVRLWGR